MEKLSYLISTLDNAKIFEKDVYTEGDEQKITSLLFFDDNEADKTIKKIKEKTLFTELEKEGSLLYEFCIIYDGMCGVLCTDTSEEEITVRDVFMFGKAEREIVLVIQTLLALVQSPEFGKKIISFEFESEEKTDAFEKALEGVSTSDMPDIDPMWDYIQEEEIANLRTYQQDIRWQSILEVLKDSNISFRYEYADYSEPKLFVTAGKEEICFMYSQITMEDICTGYELSVYKTRIKDKAVELTELIHVFKEGLSLDAEYVVHEQIEKLIRGEM